MSKTGGMGGEWVEIEKPRPPAVADHYRYWGEAPPERSERCAYWLRQIARGWLPNKRLRAEGYDTSAEMYGVYIWEYLHEIQPAVRQMADDMADTRPPDRPK